MFSIIYEDVSNSDITCYCENYSEHLTPRVFRHFVEMTIFDIQNEVDCHSTRAYIFFNESLSDVKRATGDFDSTKMMIMCNVLVTSMAHTDENDRYCVNTWVHRDKDVMSYLYSSKPLF